MKAQIFILLAVPSIALAVKIINSKPIFSIRHRVDFAYAKFILSVLVIISHCVILSNIVNDRLMVKTLSFVYGAGSCLELMDGLDLARGGFGLLDILLLGLSAAIMITGIIAPKNQNDRELKKEIEKLNYRIAKNAKTVTDAKKQLAENAKAKKEIAKRKKVKQAKKQDLYIKAKDLANNAEIGGTVITYNSKAYREAVEFAIKGDYNTQYLPLSEIAEKEIKIINELDKYKRLGNTKKFEICKEK